MDIDLAKRPGAGVYESVRLAGFGDDDIARDRVELLCGDGEASRPLQDDEQFGVWVPV